MAGQNNAVFFGKEIDYGFLDKPVNFTATELKKIDNPEGCTFRRGNGSNIAIIKAINTKGGEGKIYEIDDQNLVAKIYYEKYRTFIRYKKIEYQLSHKPKTDSVCWPIDTLFYNDKFIGFIMPKMEWVLLKSLISNPKKQLIKRGIKFSRDEQVKMLVNTAEIFSDLHSSGIVVGDVKMENIMVEPNTNSICLIDADSVQIGQFPCITSTPGFDSPEVILSVGNNITKKISTDTGEQYYYNIYYAKYYRTLNHDRHALAVLLFKMLIGGKDPYSCLNYVDTTPDDSDDQDVICIANRKFAFGLTERELSEHAQDFDKREWSYLPSYIKEAFVSTFKGNKIISADEWVKLFKEYQKDLINKKFIDNDIKHNTSANYSEYEGRKMSEIISCEFVEKGFLMTHAVVKLIKRINDDNLLRRYGEIADALKKQPAYMAGDYNFSLVYNIGILKKVKVESVTI